MELDIPRLLGLSDEMAMGSSINIVMRYTALGDGHRADACIGCGQCTQACPQKIRVPEEMRKFAELMGQQKSWEEICRERAAAVEAQKKL